jgi:NADH-quinone oxidoreductase subunit C
MASSPVLDSLRAAMPGVSLTDAASADGMPAIVVERGELVEVCRTLRDHPDLQFALFVDATIADLAPATPRFHAVYLLACLGAAFAQASGPAEARRLRLKVLVPDDDPRLPSLTPVYPAAGWPEREIYDLFGIRFDDHPDLRRILMPDDWEGYPLRKDYPVQIRKETSGWEPLQITAEEFAANLRAARDARRPPPGDT